MLRNILLSLFVTAILSFSVLVAADEKPAVAIEAAADAPQTEIILSDFDLDKLKQEEPDIENVSLYGPYSIQSLPPDVQQKILNGFDTSGQPSAATLVRQQLADQKKERDDKLNVEIRFQQSRSDVDRLVRAVRDNNIGGWNVNVKRRSGGVMLYFKKKF